MKQKNSQSHPIKSCGFNFFRNVLILSKLKPTILRQFIKSSNLVVSLAKKSHVSTKGTLSSALETSSEKKKNYPILCENIKESKEVPLFIYPQDKFCTFICLRRHIGTANMRKVQFLTVSIVFTKYFVHAISWRY